MSRYCAVTGHIFASQIGLAFVDLVISVRDLNDMFLQIS
jgi:hypothetical protein